MRQPKRVAYETDWSDSTAFVMAASVEQVERWVGNDPRRAQLVVVVESSRAKPRRQLLAKMEALTSAA